jgi:ATP phosphoribosyltransferase
MDVGLCGIDWIKETQADVEVVCDLVYSKASDQPCRWVLVVVLLLAFVPALST